jgi:CYTH domain-containing protein
MGKEIERKWLMDGFPEWIDHDVEYDIHQGYLSINPEVRIRNKIQSNLMCSNGNFKLCIKGNGNLTRTEVQMDISRQEYMELYSLIVGAMIFKKYRRYALGKYILEISNVDSSFYYAEIEFKSEEEANNFIVPDWFGKEVTYDKSYKMKNYFVRKNSEGGLK